MLVSDGVTEFLSSGDVIDFVHGLASRGVTPDEVCAALLACSHLAVAVNVHGKL